MGGESVHWCVSASNIVERDSLFDCDFPPLYCVCGVADFCLRDPVSIGGEELGAPACEMVFIDGFLVLFGGFHESAQLDTLSFYSAAEDQWYSEYTPSQGPGAPANSIRVEGRKPSPRDKHGMCAHGTK
jgi:hypothetical protein